MAITELFRKAVLEKNVRDIHIMMKDSLLVDLTFQEFDEMERLAQGVPKLYDLHDGRAFLTDSASWNDEYMNKLMVQVVGNFSHERIEHLKEVVRHLRPITTTQRKRVASVTPNTLHEGTKQTYHEQKRADERNGKVICNRGVKITAGAVAGGVVGGTVAAVAGGSMVAGAVVGAVIAGVVVVVLTTSGGR